MNNIEYSVYFLIKDNVVIYIGCTKNIKNRIASHRCNKEFDSFCIVYKSTSKYSSYRYERMITIITSLFPNFVTTNKTVKRWNLNNYFEKVSVKQKKG